MGRSVAPLVTRSAMILPTMGESAKPCAENPKAWKAPSAVLAPITGISSAIRPSIPAQQRTIRAPRMAGKTTAAFAALVARPLGSR